MGAGILALVTYIFFASVLPALAFGQELNEATCKKTGPTTSTLVGLIASKALVWHVQIEIVINNGYRMSSSHSTPPQILYHILLTG